ncbi:aspartate aminotransferase family protein [Pukyongiella litopenaei]|uniref:Aspartate aminotransferase family protein n=1 Tax=Pukyongiella litopenaei TaxID=2605946 RepID=A0A2S0MT13_9RHOB|nr:aspartate aminotransferase family protein [Pukyongiella litopenaei]AVO39002.1 aspartate aminotransferase family protein [Pukyongiella litopenaei]
MTMPNSTAELDRAAHLHPYTDARKLEAEGPRVIDRGDGVFVFDEQGNSYLEGLSGLWSVGVGFNQPRLVEAAAEQMARLPYYHTFAQKTHGPAARLADKLVEMTPEGLTRVFFTSSGSEANDTVVKMLWYFNNARGRPEKKKFISRLGGYHGITIASGSLTGLPWNHTDFDLPAIPVRHVTSPNAWQNARDGESEADFAQRLADELEAVIAEEGAETIAAFIGEPLMGAGGVIVPPEGYWDKVQEICRRHEILIVADEVITGFGRTGNLWGCDTFGIKPDVLVMSKQLTSSYMPLAAIAISDEIYQGIADNSARHGTFGHGFTASGHPVATAVALENIAIIEEQGLVANGAAVGAALQAELRRRFGDHPLVGEVRGTGMIAAVQLCADRSTRRALAPEGKLGGYVFERAHDHGLIIRNIKDAVAFCPPLILSEAQMHDMLDRFALTLDDALDWARAEGLV